MAVRWQTTDPGPSEAYIPSLTALTPLDEDLKSQYEDQFIIGGEYQIGPVWSVGARYVDRQLRRIIEDIGTFTDPSDPLALTGYVIGNPGEGFFGAPFDKPSRSYRALELSLQKTFSNRWHLNSSFVYAQAKGNHEGLYMSGYDQLDPNITALYDIPSFLPNSDGKLRGDKPYQFKVFWRLCVRLGADHLRRDERVIRRADFSPGPGDRQRVWRWDHLPAATWV